MLKESDGISVDNSDFEFPVETKAVNAKSEQNPYTDEQRAKIELFNFFYDYKKQLTRALKTDPDNRDIQNSLSLIDEHLSDLTRQQNEFTGMRSSLDDQVAYARKGDELRAERLRGYGNYEPRIVSSGAAETIPGEPLADTIEADKESLLNSITDVPQSMRLKVLRLELISMIKHLRESLDYDDSPNLQVRIDELEEDLEKTKWLIGLNERENVRRQEFQDRTQ